MKSVYMIRYWDGSHQRQYSFIGRPTGTCEYEETSEAGYPTGVIYWIGDDDIIALAKRGRYSEAA